jgi:hypothetical protein
MTGFDKKTIHFKNNGKKDVEFSILVDFLGNDEWNVYKKIRVKANGYSYYTFPDGYSAHWVKLSVDKKSVVTAQFIYN